MSVAYSQKFFPKEENRHEKGRGYFFSEGCKIWEHKI